MFLSLGRIRWTPMQNGGDDDQDTVPITDRCGPTEGIYEGCNLKVLRMTWFRFQKRWVFPSLMNRRTENYGVRWGNSRNPLNEATKYGWCGKRNLKCEPRDRYFVPMDSVFWRDGEGKKFLVERPFTWVLSGRIFKESVQTYPNLEWNPSQVLRLRGKDQCISTIILGLWGKFVSRLS